MKRWPTKPLGDFVAQKSGSVDPSKYPDEVFDLYSIPAFDSGEPEVRAGEEIGSAKQVVQSRDVLLSRIVPHIRRAWVVGADRGRRIIASGEWIVFRSLQLHPCFLRYSLVGEAFHARFMQTVSGVGGSLLRAKATEVAKIEIPVPPLAEQERIVKLLDEADELRKLRAQADRRTAALIPALFHEMFGDPATNTRKWKRESFADLLDGIDGGWSPTCHDRLAQRDEWGVLKLGAVTTCEYLDTETKALPEDLAPRPELEVKAGDLLFTRKNTYELVAACAFVFETRPKLMLSDLIFRFQLKPGAELNPVFLWGLLTVPSKRKQVQALAGGSAGSMPNISKGRLMTLPIEVPALPLQKEFAERVTEIRELEAGQAASRLRLEALFQSLLHRAFNGEL